MSFGIAWWLVGATGISESISLTRADYPGWDVPSWVFVIFAGLIIWATTNAVNVTDGLDGLAGGSALMGFGAFMIIGYTALRFHDVYRAVVNPLDLTALAAAFAGACMGFLWFNAAPARIIMGDVGALGLGSALAMLALTTNTQLLLLLICGINVMEAGSVAAADGRVQGERPQEAAVPHVADPPPLRADRLARDHRDHPLLADRRDLRGGRARHLHRRLHPHLLADLHAVTRGAGLRARGRRRGDGAGAAAARHRRGRRRRHATTPARRALAAELGVDLRVAPGRRRARRAPRAPATSSSRHPACPRTTA